MPPVKIQTLFYMLLCLIFTSCAVDQDLININSDSELPIESEEAPEEESPEEETPEEETPEEKTPEEETPDEEIPEEETPEEELPEEEIPDEETPEAQDKILVFTKTEDFRHSSIETGIQLFTMLGSDNDFQVDQSEDALNFNDVTLQDYQLVVFLNTSGDVLNLSQQTAFEKYIQDGGSYMGVHAATDTEHDWPWYGQLAGAYFDNHPVIQNATMTVELNNHQSTQHLESNWSRTDEWYNFKDLSSNINVLLLLDESSYLGGTNGDNHPIAWYHEFDGGRSFYTGGGHTEESYEDADFQQHLLGGILYCLERE